MRIVVGIDVGEVLPELIMALVDKRLTEASLIVRYILSTCPLVQ